MRSATNEEQIKTLEAVCTWIETAAKAGVDVFKGGPMQFRANMWHSSLLNRLLSGRQPLAEPPPIRYSYPNYELAEGQECIVGVHRVWTIASLRRAEEAGIGEESKTITIDQSVWEVVEVRADASIMVVRWPGQAALYLLKEREGEQIHPGINGYTLKRIGED